MQNWISNNKSLLVNASSLMGTTVITSGLGFAYWWVAARFFAEVDYGLASAAISSMMLLGTIGSLGLGSLLIGELPRAPERAVSYMMTSVLIISLACALLGFLYAEFIPLISPELSPVVGTLPNLLLFISGVILTGVTITLDRAVIGLMQGEVQLWRNTIFSVVKLVLLFLFGAIVSQDPMIIYLVWVVGNLVSLVPMARVIQTAKRKISSSRFIDLSLLKHFGRSALAHHSLNIALMAPPLILPIIVTAVLSVEDNAVFYTCWMLVNFAYVVPAHLSTALHAIGAKNVNALAAKLGTTLQLSALMGAAACVGFMLFSNVLLGIFGESYQRGAPALQILSLGVFSYIIKHHYVAIRRVENRVSGAALTMAVIGLVELVAAAFGAARGGLVGLCVGLIIVNYVQIPLLLPVFYRILFLGKTEVHARGKTENRPVMEIGSGESPAV